MTTHLISFFEVVNEPYFEISSSEMNELNMLIIDAIRSTGGNNAFRPIIITGGSSSSYQAPFAISEEVLEFDSNLIASFHYYQPFNFTSSSREEYNNFNWGSVNDKSIVDLHFDEVKQWSQDNNIPVTLGEFGADNENGINYNTGYMGYMVGLLMRIALNITDILLSKPLIEVFRSQLGVVVINQIKLFI